MARHQPCLASDSPGRTSGIEHHYPQIIGKLLETHDRTDRRIVIEPAQRKEYDLAELLKGITRENLHDEANFGRPVGKEAL